MSYVFQTLFTDTFNRPNESPLSDNGAWEVFPAEGDVMQVLSDTCTVTFNDDGIAISKLTNIVLPPDQWCSFQVSYLGAEGDVYIVLRSDAAFLVGYNFEFIGPLNDSAASFSVNLTDSAGNDIYDFAIETHLTIQENDVFLVGVIGQFPTGQLVIYQNGVEIFSASMGAAPSGIASGPPFFFELDGLTSQTDVGIKNISVGSMQNSGGGQGNSPLGNVIFDLDSDGFPIVEIQTGTDA